MLNLAIRPRGRASLMRNYRTFPGCQSLLVPGASAGWVSAILFPLFPAWTRTREDSLYTLPSGDPETRPHALPFFTALSGTLQTWIGCLPRPSRLY